MDISSSVGATIGTPYDQRLSAVPAPTPAPAVAHVVPHIAEPAAAAVAHVAKPVTPAVTHVAEPVIPVVAHFSQSTVVVVPHNAHPKPPVVALSPALSVAPSALRSAVVAGVEQLPEAIRYAPSQVHSSDETLIAPVFDRSA